MSIINYVTYGASGELTGAYEQEVRPEHLDCFIPVAYEQRSDWTSYRATAGRDGIELIPPVVAVPRIPQEVTAEQIALALLSTGHWADVRAYFAGLPDDDAGERARIRFQRSPTVRRDCDLVAAVVTSLSLTGAQADALFIAAAAFQ